MAIIVCSRPRSPRPAAGPGAVPVHPHRAGVLPRFSRSLGLDFIVTPAGQPLLVELQHGFGRRGMSMLFPEMGRGYRKTYWGLRRAQGTCPQLNDGLRMICSDKIQTYLRFASVQPASRAYFRYTPAVDRWLCGLSSLLILIKPPRGSCGAGIEVMEREAFRRLASGLSLPYPALLQEYVESRRLPGPEGGEHVGCIRHILILESDGSSLGFVHMPSYWRVSPLPFAGIGQREGLTANISRGAFPLPVSEEDVGLILPLAEAIAAALVREVLDLGPLSIRPGRRVSGGIACGPAAAAAPEAAAGPPAPRRSWPPR